MVKKVLLIACIITSVSLLWADNVPLEDYLRMNTNERWRITSTPWLYYIITHQYNFKGEEISAACHELAVRYPPRMPSAVKTVVDRYIRRNPDYRSTSSGDVFLKRAEDRGIAFDGPAPRNNFFKNSYMVMKEDDTLRLSSIVLLAGNVSKATWESSDPEVIEVDTNTNTIKAKSAGLAQVTAVIQGNASAVSITVLNKNIDYQVVPHTSEVRVIASAVTPGTRDIEKYKTDPKYLLAYKFNNPLGFDIIGKGGDVWMWTTFSQSGWRYDLNGQQNNMNNGVQTDSNGVTLTVEPFMVYEDGIPYILVVHTLKNTSAERRTGQRFGAAADVMINTNDHAPLRITDYGALMTDSINASNSTLSLTILCKSGIGVTPVNTLWIGQYGDHMGHIYDDGASPYYRDGVDSAIAFSYQNIDLAPGETKVCNVRFTLANSGAEPITAEVLPDLAVDSLDLAEYIKAPVKDAEPDTNIRNVQYSGTVVWKVVVDGEDSDFIGNFAEGNVYRAIVNLSPRAGYTFDGFDSAFTFNNLGEGTIDTSTASNAATVTITFEQIPVEEAAFEAEYPPAD